MMRLQTEDGRQRGGCAPQVRRFAGLLEQASGKTAPSAWFLPPRMRKFCARALRKPADDIAEMGTTQDTKNKGPKPQTASLRPFRRIRIKEKDPKPKPGPSLLSATPRAR